MCMVSDNEGPAPGPSNRISTDDWDEEQHTSLGICAANLKRMSLGIDRGAPACIKAKNVKKGLPTKRNVKRPKRTTKESALGQTYKQALPCYNMNKVFKPRPGYKKDQVVAIWANCKLCKYKNLDFKAFGVKTTLSISPLWSRCAKYV